MVAAAIGFWVGLQEGTVPDGAAARVAWFALLSVPVVLAVLHAVLFRRLGARRRWGSVGFQLGRRKAQRVFTCARTQVPYGTFLILMCGFLADGAGRIVHGWPDTSYRVVGQLLVTSLVGWGLGGMFARSALVLAPDGIRIGSLRTRLIPWDTVDPSGLRVPGPHESTLSIPLVAVVAQRPAVAGRSPAAQSDEGPVLGLGPGYDTNANALVADDRAPVAPADDDDWVDVDVDVRQVATELALIVDALAHYAGDPAARADIGTSAGYAALNRARTSA